jgi:hypothetical protein
MKVITDFEQGSHEWWQAKKGRIGGTRFGQVISNRKNRLVYELANEILTPVYWPDDYVNEEMQFGIDNEPVAIALYEEAIGMKFTKPGLFLPEYPEQAAIHCASPDGWNTEHGIVVEVKSTQNGAIHLQRFAEGVESSYMPQIRNYFAISDDVKQVHWLSFCPDRPEMPTWLQIFTREQFAADIPKWRAAILQTKYDVDNLLREFCKF